MGWSALVGGNPRKVREKEILKKPKPTKQLRDAHLKTMWPLLSEMQILHAAWPKVEQSLWSFPTPKPSDRPLHHSACWHRELQGWSCSQSHHCCGWQSRSLLPRWAGHQVTFKDLGWSPVHLQSKQKLTVEYAFEEAGMWDRKMVFFLDFCDWTNDHDDTLYFYRTHLIAQQRQNCIGLLFSETSHLNDIHTGLPEKKPQASSRLCLTLLKRERQN